jgi:uncharacterized protein
MDRRLIPYTIPLVGSKLGISTYQWRCDDAFFDCFPESPVRAGEVDVTLSLDKQTDMMLLHFTLGGHIGLVCDRCTADIRFPFGEVTYELIVKPGDAFEEEDDIVYLPPEATELNVAQFIYEFVVLAIPVSKTYACEDEDPRPCDMDVLNLLVSEINDSEKPIDEADNPFHQLLKDLKNN